MKVEFFDNRTVRIDNTLIGLGDSLIELLNDKFFYPTNISTNMLGKLENIIPTYSSTVSFVDYMNKLIEVKNLIKEVNLIWNSLPFYKYQKEPIFTYTFVDGLLEYLSEVKAKCDWDNLSVMKMSDFLKLYSPPFRKEDIFEMNEAIQKTVPTISEWRSIHENFIKLVDVCLNPDTMLDKSSSLKSLHDYGIKRINYYMDPSLMYPKDIRNPLSMSYDIVCQDGEYLFTETYDIFSATNFFYFEFINLIKSGIQIKKCKNCGKYFVIKGSYNNEYCENIPEGETRPCREIGPFRQYAEKMKEDPILDAYNRSYKTHFARMRNRKIDKEDLEQWKIDAKKMKDLAINNEITIEEFKIWLKK